MCVPWYEQLYYRITVSCQCWFASIEDCLGYFCKRGDCILLDGLVLVRAVEQVLVHLFTLYLYPFNVSKDGLPCHGSLPLLVNACTYQLWGTTKCLHKQLASLCFYWQAHWHHNRLSYNCSTQLFKKYRHVQGCCHPGEWHQSGGIRKWRLILYQQWMCG